MAGAYSLKGVRNAPGPYISFCRYHRGVKGCEILQIELASERESSKDAVTFWLIILAICIIM
jgi:hypothetical protein